MERAIDKLEPFQRAISKAHLAAAGVAVDSLENPDKPLIAIANSWNEVCPGHEPLRKLAEEVKKGVDYIVEYRQDDQTKAKPSSIIKLGDGGLVQVIR